MPTSEKYSVVFKTDLDMLIGKSLITKYVSRKRPFIFIQID